LALDELRSLSPAFDQDFYESLKLASVLAVHDVPGGTAPARVRHAINIIRKRIESLREEIHAHA
jgi:argininosuccinate lyase